ncbi:MAG: hypothetical protein KDC48_12380 [Planctomycetes bacterium]|nr:hypothetical protein [Planctomycetota bacterium]
MIRFLAIGALLASLATSITAQELLWRVEGVGGQIRRGQALRALGDVDRDGWEDMVEIVSYRTAPGAWCCFETSVAVVSGRDGSILSTAPALVGNGLESVHPFSLARTGDMDGDGWPDYAYMRWDATPAITQDVVVRSGRNHRVLWKRSAWFGGDYGVRIAGDMDLDGDGRNDLVTCDTRQGPYGTLFAYDNSGQLLYQITNQDPTILMGVDVAPLGGDLDQDGGDDFLVVCPDTTGRSVILVLSGRTGAILRRSYGELPGDFLYFTIGCGDLDGDGVPDYAGGAHDLANHCVSTYSGATGNLIYSYRNPSMTQQGCGSMGAELAAQDLDHDGVNDLIAMSWGCFLFALNGRTGDEMFHFNRSTWPMAGATCMGAATLLAPPPHELYPVVVYAEDCWNSVPNNYGNPDPGLLWAYRTSPPTATTFGRSTSSTPDLARMGMRDLSGTSARFTLSAVPPNAIAFLALGFSSQSFLGTPLPAPLAPFGFAGMTLRTSLDAYVFAVTGNQGTSSGYAQIDLPLHLAPTGITVFAQWHWIDPANLHENGSSIGHAFVAR